MELIKSDLTKMDSQVQTSLRFLDDRSREEFEQELHSLREDKTQLEGKVRGYLALSEICKEYKEDYRKLQAEYQQLLTKVNANKGPQLSLSNGSPAFSSYNAQRIMESERIKANESDKRTTISLDDTNNCHISVSSSKRSIQTKQNQSGDAQIKTELLFGAGLDPTNIAGAEGEAYEEMPPAPSQTGESSGSSFEKFPMQESLVHTLDTTSLKDNNHHGYDMLLSQSHYKKEVIGDIKEALQSVKDENGTPEVRGLLSKLEEYINKVETDSKKVKKLNEVLLIKNSELETNLRSKTSELNQLQAQLQYQMQLSQSPSQTQGSRGTPSDTGWVHVEKGQLQETPKTSTLSDKQTEEKPVDVKKLRETISQLREANQRWSQEWGKLQEHYDQRIQEICTERDRLSKELMEWKLDEDTKQRDYEKMLTNAKKKAADEECSKEDALTQLSSANHRCEALQLEVAELKEIVATLRRSPGNHSVTTSARHMTPSTTGDMETEIEVLRHQLIVFQEDFDRERQDRAMAQSIKDDFKKQNDSLKKRIRTLEQKISATENQLKLSEDTNKRTMLLNDRMQTEINQLKSQLQREQESRMFVPQSAAGAIQPPNIPGNQYNQTYGHPNMAQFMPQLHHQPQQQYMPQQHYPNMFGGPQMVYMSPASPQLQTSDPQPQRLQQQTGGTFSQSAMKAAPLTSSVWSCNHCTYKNLPQRTVCEMCGYIRSSGQKFNFRTGSSEHLRPRGDEISPGHPTRTPTQNDLVVDAPVRLV